MPKHPTTIRLDPATHKAAVKRAAALGFETLSEYIETLLRIDAEQNLEIVLVRNETGVHLSARPFQESADSTALSAKKKPKKKNGSRA